MEREPERCHGRVVLGEACHWVLGCYGWVGIGSAGRQATFEPSGHPLISWAHLPLGSQNVALFGEVVNPFRSGALWEEVGHCGWEELLAHSLALVLGLSRWKQAVFPH